MPRDLPPRWTRKHSAIYYVVPAGLEHQWDGKRWFRLGKNVQEAWVTWLQRLGTVHRTNITTIGALLDRYASEVVPTKALCTHKDQLRAIENLRGPFAKLPLTGIKPSHIYRYVDARSAKTAARREVEVLSHAFTKALQWGLIDRHPWQGQVRLDGRPAARTRYVEDWEVDALLGLKAARRTDALPMVQAYVRLKLLTGLRQRDLLLLTMSDLKDDGIHVQPSKTKQSTGKRLVYAWTPELRAAVDACLSARRTISPYVICDGKGQCFVDDRTGRAGDWQNTWQRVMRRVLSETAVTERFTEHDLRAKVASDADSTGRAQELLAHSDAGLTERVYRRKAVVVKPAR